MFADPRTLWPTNRTPTVDGRHWVSERVEFALCHFIDFVRAELNSPIAGGSDRYTSGKSNQHGRCYSWWQASGDLGRRWLATCFRLINSPICHIRLQLTSTMFQTSLPQLPIHVTFHLQINSWPVHAKAKYSTAIGPPALELPVLFVILKSKDLWRISLL